MTATHPQPLDLEPIRRRAATLNGAWDHEYATPDAPSKAIASAEDVPALLTEVERLRAQIDAAYRFADTWSASRHVASPEIGASLRRVLDEAKPDSEATP